MTDVCLSEAGPMFLNHDSLRILLYIPQGYQADIPRDFGMLGSRDVGRYVINDRCV